ncbi:hypothetical protein GCM10022214_04330 [Actinomadura miaoliensis]|uniref:Tetracyclin repressor-like C-terminal domain-containing protein n=1 Tax=Actinomadura miaoliensis TaxID=430685 RepID=A0ABP7UZ80_9ACTN
MVFAAAVHDLTITAPADSGSLRADLTALCADLAASLTTIPAPSLLGLLADITPHPASAARIQEAFVVTERAPARAEAMRVSSSPGERDPSGGQVGRVGGQGAHRVASPVLSAAPAPAGLQNRSSRVRAFRGGPDPGEGGRSLQHHVICDGARRVLWAGWPFSCLVRGSSPSAGRRGAWRRRCRRRRRGSRRWCSGPRA